VLSGVELAPQQHGCGGHEGGCVFHGSQEHSVGNIVNVSVPGWTGKELTRRLNRAEFIISASSACHARKLTPAICCLRWAAPRRWPIARCASPPVGPRRRVSCIRCWRLSGCSVQRLRFVSAMFRELMLLVDEHKLYFLASASMHARRSAGVRERACQFPDPRGDSLRGPVHPTSSRRRGSRVASRRVRHPSPRARCPERPF